MTNAIQKKMAVSIILLLIAVGLIPVVALLLEYIGYGSGNLNNKLSEIIHHYNAPVAFGMFFIFGCILCLYSATKKLLIGLLPLLVISVFPLVSSKEKTDLELAVEILDEKVIALENQQISDQRNFETISNSEMHVKPTGWIGRGRHESLNYKAEDGFCFLTGVKGKWEGGGEYANVYIHADGTWWVRVIGAQPAVAVTISCVNYPLNR